MKNGVALLTFDFIELTDPFNLRKKKIQTVLYDKFEVKVDLCLQGHGTRNTGNLARRCFNDPKLFAECLELDYTFVQNLAHIIICFRAKKRVRLE